MQKQCGPMIERRNTVGPLKRKVLICLGCTKNGLLMPLSTCSVLSHGAFMWTCPFLVTWVCLVEDIYVSPKFPCRELTIYYLVGLRLVLVDINIKFLSE